jgi:hypothetical protein
MRRGARGRPPPGPPAARGKRGEGGWPARERAGSGMDADRGSAAFTCVVVSPAVSSASPLVLTPPLVGGTRLDDPS